MTKRPPSLLLFGRRTTNPLVLSRVLSTHHPPVSGTLSTLPESSSLFTYQIATAESTRLDSRRIVLLAATPAADDAVGPFIDMVFLAVMALVAGMYAATA